jgi:hypothetical protein
MFVVTTSVVLNFAFYFYNFHKKHLIKTYINIKNTPKNVEALREAPLHF